MIALIQLVGVLEGIALITHLALIQLVGVLEGIALITHPAPCHGDRQSATNHDIAPSFQNGKQRKIWI